MQYRVLEITKGWHRRKIGWNILHSKEEPAQTVDCPGLAAGLYGRETWRSIPKHPQRQFREPPVRALKVLLTSAAFTSVCPSAREATAYTCDSQIGGLVLMP